MGDKRMGYDRRGVRRATVGVAALLTLMLLLHHPLMGLAPMTPMAGLSGHGLPMAASSVAMPMGGASRATRAAATAGTQDTSVCAGCAMTCPLMDGVTPDRSALPLSTSQRAGHAAWPPVAAIRATLPSRGTLGDPTTGAAGHTPAQRTRRAILQVYLL